MPDDYDFTKRLRKPISNTPYITYILIVISIVMTAAYWIAQEQKTLNSPVGLIASFGIPNEAKIWSGHVYYLLTAVFLHGSWAHILFNMYWLYKLGGLLEITIPRYAYLGFVIASAMVSSGVELCLFGHSGIGISGVVYALFGILWAGRGTYQGWRIEVNSETFRTFVAWAVICVVTTTMGIMNVANGAHFGGMLFGMALGWLFIAPRRQTVWAIPLVITVLMTLLSVVWLPWRAEWCLFKGDQQRAKQKFDAASSWYERGYKSFGDKTLLYYANAQTWTAYGLRAEALNDKAEVERANQKLKEIEVLLEESFQAHQKPSPNETDASSSALERIQKDLQGNKTNSKDTTETNEDR